ncbi:MAG: hypothetical protein JXB50_07905 [Spirochaetes bacterium]|nr:hypothetical protein [Spirochaetota bacterium]
MRVTVLNTAHFDLKVGDKLFPAFKEVILDMSPAQEEFRNLRCYKQLRVNRTNNKSFMESLGLKHNGKTFNFCYDIQSQYAGESYKYAIQALSNPIIKYLKNAGYSNRPLTTINCRFFSSKRINQFMKVPVGPYDVFFSHGIGDKNYWIGKNIKDYNYAFVPGPAWQKRMRETGYKGEIFVCGYTKLDPLINGEVKKTERKKPYIVWMPTHGYNGSHSGRSSYPECLSLINNISNNYEKSIALHPTSKLNSNIKHTPTFQELIDADVIIADAGSTIYESWILGKPVIFPDWICKRDVLAHFKDDPNNFEYKIYNENIGYHAADINHLNELIEIALKYGMKDKSKEFIDTIYPEKIRGQAGKLAAKYLNQIATSLNIK